METVESLTLKLAEACRVIQGCLDRTMTYEEAELFLDSTFPTPPIHKGCAHDNGVEKCKHDIGTHWLECGFLEDSLCEKSKYPTCPFCKPKECEHDKKTLWINESYCYPRDKYDECPFCKPKEPDTLEKGVDPECEKRKLELAVIEAARNVRDSTRTPQQNDEDWDALCDAVDSLDAGGTV